MSHIIIDVEQGTPAWHAARAGVTTASMFGIAVSEINLLDERQQKYVNSILAGAPEEVARDMAGYKAKPTSSSIQMALRGEPTISSTAASIAYADELALEIISGKPYGDTFQTYAMRRGSEEERWARVRYEQLYNVEVVESGIALTEDRRFGYSTDGSVVLGGKRGNIEVKTPLSTAKIRHVLETDDSSEYDHQIQGGMGITNAEFCDLVMWVPDLSIIGNDIYVKRIYRDDDFIDRMFRKLVDFNRRVDDAVRFFRTPFRRDGLADETTLRAAAPAAPHIVTDVVAKAAPTPAPAPAALPPVSTAGMSKLSSALFD